MSCTRAGLVESSFPAEKWPIFGLILGRFEMGERSTSWAGVAKMDTGRGRAAGRRSRRGMWQRGAVRDSGNQDRGSSAAADEGQGLSHLNSLHSEIAATCPSHLPDVRLRFDYDRRKKWCGVRRSVDQSHSCRRERVMDVAPLLVVGQAKEHAWGACDLSIGCCPFEASRRS